MKNLVIVAAGGCGRETLQWVKDINKIAPKWNIKGFLDDNLDSIQGKRCGIPILSKIDEYEICSDDEFICCVGNGIARKRLTERLKAKGAVFTNVIHPSAVIAESGAIGEGVIVYPFALVSTNAVIGNGCIINMYSSVAHDAVLGKFCTISAHCDITGMCKLGNNVFMGTSAHTVPGTTIGDDAYICAGSTVMTNVRNNRKMLGNPAKPIDF